MKILIAGATGAIGTPLSRALLAAGHEVVGITRSPADGVTNCDPPASSRSSPTRWIDQHC